MANTNRMLRERLLRTWLTARDRFVDRRDRGDVPGWVLITVMTVGLVALLFTAAKDRLVPMFEDALDSFNT